MDTGAKSRRGGAPMPGRATTGAVVAALAAVGALAALAGCGGRAAVGDVHAVEPVAVGGVVSAVRIPGGELEVRVTSLLDEDPGRPYGDGEEGATGPFVGIAWEPVATGPDAVMLAEAMEETEVAALVDDERVVLSDPDAMVESNGLPASAAAVVSVPDGYDVADLRIEVVVDGVAQGLDPWAGSVEAGGAAALYDDAPTRWTPRPCEELGVQPPLRTFPGDGALCDVGTLATSPWHSDLGWAPEDALWWTVYVGTHMVLGDLGAADDPDGGEPWGVGPLLTHEVTLDGTAPAAELPAAQGATTPVASESQTYGWYTFAGPADPPASADDATLRIRQTYAVLADGVAAPPADEAVVDVTVPVGPAVATGERG